MQRLIEDLAEQLEQLKLLNDDLEQCIPEHLHLQAVRDQLPEILQELIHCHQNLLDAQP